jgi:hypothetical protein
MASQLRLCTTGFLRRRIGFTNPPGVDEAATAAAPQLIQVSDAASEVSRGSTEMSQKAAR